MNQRKLREVDALSILEAIPGCHLILLPDAPHFTIVGVTDAYLKGTYTSREQIIGKGVFEVFTDNAENPHATGVRNLSTSLNFVVAHKKPHKMALQRYDVINPTTGSFELKVWRPYNKPVVDENGAISYLIHTVEDVTENERLQEENRITDQRLVKSEDRTLELEKLNEALNRANANLEQFAYAASHDMKEPIRKIHFFSERLKQQLEGQLTTEQSHLFSRMKHAAKRMDTLIDDLLTYSNVSVGVADSEQIDLNQELKGLLESLELEIEEKNAKVIVDPLPVVKGHRWQMHQLFENLISNALKYQKPGVPPEIHIRAKVVSGNNFPRFNGIAAQQQYHQIEIRDNGIGFNPEDAERIFNIFTRLHGISEYRGTGVGLSIVQKIAENHSGYIWAEGKEGVGATFWLLLPVYE